MVRERSVSGAQDESESASDPLTNSSDNPPSYEESVADDWNTNLTWPNTLVNREELQSLFQVNNYDYSTRGRAFTVTGGADPTGPRYRNIINYFEHSLDDISSIDWSGPSITRSYRQIPQHYNSSSEFCETNLVRAKSVPGPRPPSSGTRTRDNGANWQHLNEHPEPNRFTVLPVPNTEELAVRKPPEYSYKDTASDSKGISFFGTLSPLSEENRPHIAGTRGTCDIDLHHLNHSPPNRQPSAPSLDEIHLEECLHRYNRPQSRGFERSETAPARLTDMEDPLTTKRTPVDEEPIGEISIIDNCAVKDTEKCVTFKVESENINPNIDLGLQNMVLNESMKKNNTSVLEILNSSHPLSDESSIIDKKESRTSETGDSGFEESFNTAESNLLGLRTGFESRAVTYLPGDLNKAKSMDTESYSRHWEEHHLFRIEESKKATCNWKCIFGVCFFVIDIILILVGTFLLILDYHANVIPGFTLLGVGIGLCVPALNYLGGLPTVCGGLGG